MGSRRSRWYSAVRAAAAALASLPLIVVLAPDASPATSPPSFSIAAQDGAGNSTTPGRSCAEGGAGAAWHYDYGTKLAPGAFSALDAEARVHLDLHSDTQRYTNSAGAYAPGNNAFLQGGESHVSFMNQRGSVRLRLSSGSCTSPTLAFNGSNASGAGTWVVDGGAGAYRDVAPSTGTFSIANAEVNPGADNALALSLNGTLTVPDPSLKLEILGTYWGGLGTDYLTRKATVIFKVTNNGPGDAFGAVFQSISSPTAGVTAIGPAPQSLGDLPAGASQVVLVRYQLGLLTGPCKLVLLGCSFGASATVNLPDAFDAPHVLTATVPTKAPNLPPPL